MRQLSLSISKSGLRSSEKEIPQDTHEGSVSEVILSADSALQPIYLLPMLAHLASNDRWLMWVSEENMINRRWVSSLGLNASRILYLQPDESDFASICCKALAAGTGHMIIEWSGDLDNQTLKRLESAAEKGGSHALLIRRRS